MAITFDCNCPNCLSKGHRLDSGRGDISFLHFLAPILPILHFTFSSITSRLFHTSSSRKTRVPPTHQSSNRNRNAKTSPSAARRHKKAGTARNSSKYPRNRITKLFFFPGRPLTHARVMKQWMTRGCIVVGKSATLASMVLFSRSYLGRNRWMTSRSGIQNTQCIMHGRRCTH